MVVDVRGAVLVDLAPEEVVTVVTEPLGLTATAMPGERLELAAGNGVPLRRAALTGAVTVVDARYHAVTEVRGS